VGSGDQLRRTRLASRRPVRDDQMTGGDRAPPLRGGDTQPRRTARGQPAPAGTTAAGLPPLDGRGGTAAAAASRPESGRAGGTARTHRRRRLPPLMCARLARRRSALPPSPGSQTRGIANARRALRDRARARPCHPRATIGDPPPVRSARARPASTPQHGRLRDYLTTEQAVGISPAARADQPAGVCRGPAA
jgi:hypothetical protein